MFDYTSSILKIWVKSSMKNANLITFLMIISIYSIFTECLNTIARLFKFYTRQEVLDADDIHLSKLNSVNPLHYLQNFILSGNISISQCSATNCSLDNTLILVIAGLVTGLFIIHHLMAYYFHFISTSSKSSNSQDPSENRGSNSSLSDLFNLILVNFIDVILKIFSVFIFYIFLNKIFVSFYLNTDIVIAVISVVFLIFFTCFSYFHINFIILFTRLSSYECLHYDNFSKISGY